MNNIYWIIVFVLISIVSCKSTKNITNTSSQVTSKRVIDLNENEKRKFDYFFYESQRLKINGDVDKAKLYLIECLRIDSLSSTCYYELANIQIQYKDFKGAEALLKKAVTLDEKNKWYKLLLGDIYQQNKKTADAISVYKDLCNLYPDNDEYVYTLAQFYVQNKQFNEAIATYDQLEKSIGLNEYISLEKEKLYLKLGKKTNAFKEIHNLIEDNPKEPRYYGFLGDFYLYYNDIDNAKKNYSKILEMDPGNGLGYFSLSNVSLLENDTTQFFMLFDKGLEDENLELDVKVNHMVPFIMKDEFKNFDHGTKIDSLFHTILKVHPEEAESYIYYANYLRSINKNEQAYINYKEGLKLDPMESDLWQDLFLIEISLNKYEDLNKDTKEALSLFPQESVFYLFNGLSYLQLEDYKSALSSLDTGLPLVNNNNYLLLQYYSYLGDVNYNLHKPDSAFAYFDKALAIDEHNVLVLNNYSYYLSLEKRDLEKAEKMISKCVELEPGSATYLDTYAWVLFQRGRYFEAKYIIERAMDNGGDSSDVIVEHYGDILYKNNDIKNALIQWKKSKDLGNKSKVLIKKIELERYVEE